jgi:hypothetical protein
MDPDRERHYEQAMKVAQAAWDFVNPPSGSSFVARYEKLRDETYRLRRLELELAQDNNLHAVLYGNS